MQRNTIAITVGAILLLSGCRHAPAGIDTAADPELPVLHKPELCDPTLSQCPVRPCARGELPRKEHVGPQPGDPRPSSWRFTCRLPR